MTTRKSFRGLSVVQGKESDYRDDAHFQRAIAHTASPQALAILAKRFSFILLKPEAVIENRLNQVFDWLDQRGYQFHEMTDVEVTRASLRELWKYQWTLFPPERITVMEALYEGQPLPLIGVTSRVPGDVPCAIQLSQDKGFGTERAADMHSLRSLLGQRNLLLNYVHTPDEPADMMRELSILLPGERLNSFLAKAVCGDGRLGQTRPSPPRTAPSIRSAADLSFDSLAHQFIASLHELTKTTHGSERQRLANIIRRWEADESDLDSLEEVEPILATHKDIQIPNYLLPCIRSYLVPMEQFGRTARYGRVSPQVWREFSDSA